MKFLTAKNLLILVFMAILAWGIHSHRDGDLLPPSEPMRESTVRITTESKTLTLQVEIAATSEQQRYGLMKRPHLPDGHGMLFVFDPINVISMWMKDTWIPLDMLFIDARYRIACIIENAEPESLEPRTCEVPARAVLELPGGYAKRQGIKVGDRVTYHVAR